jgi:hypothetical protein
MHLAEQKKMPYSPRDDAENIHSVVIIAMTTRHRHSFKKK